MFSSSTGHNATNSSTAAEKLESGNWIHTLATVGMISGGALLLGLCLVTVVLKRARGHSQQQPVEIPVHANEVNDPADVELANRDDLLVHTSSQRDNMSPRALAAMQNLWYVQPANGAPAFTIDRTHMRDLSEPLIIPSSPKSNR